MKLSTMIIQDHPQIENERDVLKCFQNKTPDLRPIIDEIVDLCKPPTIILKHWEDNLRRASIKKTLDKKEIKFVAKRIFEALKALYEGNYVLYILVVGHFFELLIDWNPTMSLWTTKTGKSGSRMLWSGDLGGAYPADSTWAKTGTPMGATIWSSPEVIVSMPWNIVTDIWSFGTAIRVTLLRHN